MDKLDHQGDEGAPMMSYDHPIGIGGVLQHVLPVKTGELVGVDEYWWKRTQNG